MDFGFSEPQEMFRRTVRDFLDKECPMTLVREIEEKKQDFDRELYRKMAGLGWLGLMIPEEYGGLGGNWVDMGIFYEEAGRGLLPSPHFTTVVLGGQVLLAFGNEEQKRELLPKIVEGDLIMALALTEPEAGSNLALLATTATPDGEDYLISGTKLFIPNAHRADHIITVTRTGEGITLFLVYDRVRVSRSKILGELNGGEGIADIVEKAKIMTCAEMVGGAQAALEMTVDLTKQRVQFDRPIGSFQALQHRMVDMTMAVEGARWLMYSVAWMNSEGIPCSKESAMAQLEAGRGYTHVTAEAIHMHGAVALMVDHDLPLYYKRAKAAQLNLGFSESQREVIVQGIGL